MVPHNSNVMVNIPLIAGIPLSIYNYKVIRNNKLECIKIYMIGQSAAKTLSFISMGKVQRLSERSSVW